MKKIMKVLRGYEMVSEKMINLEKNFVYLHEKAFIRVYSQIKSIKGVRERSFSFILSNVICFIGEEMQVILKN